MGKWTGKSSLQAWQELVASGLRGRSGRQRALFAHFLRMRSVGALPKRHSRLFLTSVPQTCARPALTNHIMGQASFFYTSCVVALASCSSHDAAQVRGRGLRRRLRQLIMSDVLVPQPPAWCTPNEHLLEWEELQKRSR